jgi:hypothetical protein
MKHEESVNRIGNRDESSKKPSNEKERSYKKKTGGREEGGRESRAEEAQQWRRSQERIRRNIQASARARARKKQSRTERTGVRSQEEEEEFRRSARLGRAMPLSISISALNRPPPLLCSPLLADLAITGDRLLQLLISLNRARLSVSCGMVSLSLSGSRASEEERRSGKKKGKDGRWRAEVCWFRPLYTLGPLPTAFLPV